MQDARYDTLAQWQAMALHDGQTSDQTVGQRKQDLRFDRPDATICNSIEIKHGIDPREDPVTISRRTGFYGCDKPQHLQTLISSQTKPGEQQDEVPRHSHDTHATLDLSNCENHEQCKQYWRGKLEAYDSSSEQSNEEVLDDLRSISMETTVSFSELSAVAGGNSYGTTASYFRVAWALVLGCILEKASILLTEIVTLPVECRYRHPKVYMPILVTNEGTVSKTLQAQLTVFRQAWSHRNIENEIIQELLGLADTSKLYDAVFEYNPEQEDIPPCLAEPEPAANPSATNLALSIKRGSRRNFKLECSLPSSMISVAQQQLLLRQVDSLIVAMTRSSEMPNSVADCLPRELISVTSPSSSTYCPVVSQPTFWVEHWAKTNPDWRAAEIITKIFPDKVVTESWTFAELNAEANRVARFIQQHHISNRAIGMCLGRTLMAYAVQLGIFKSGNTYLPLDEALPEDRKAFLLRDSDAAMVFATQDVLGFTTVPENCRLVDPEREDTQSSLARGCSSDIENQGALETNAYLLYTSGSTGLPKGVLVSRKNLTNFVEAWSELMYENVPSLEDLAGRGKYLGLASRAFDPHIGEMFLAWRHGLAAVTAEKSTLLDDLTLVLTYLGITHASFVPSLLDQTGLRPENVPDLVWLTVGGEKMSPKTKKIWGSDARVALINAYGPTEATIGCCANRIYTSSETNDVGKPLGDSVAHVLKLGSLEHAIRGAPGELCFTGSLVANGYWNRLDARGFIEDFEDERLYRTGDIVALLPDDHIRFLGRRDDQVKIRGQRVELGEVAEGVRVASVTTINAAALVLEHPELRSAQLVVFVAQAIKPARGSETCLTIVEEEISEANEVLRNRCRKSLPVFMVPDIIVPLSLIPLTPTSAKTDQKLLTQLFISTPMSTLRGSVKNKDDDNKIVHRLMTEVESKIYSIISESLVDAPQDVSYLTKVFELGCDSLSAIGLSSRLQAAGFECSLTTVLSNPSIHDLAGLPLRPDAAHEEFDGDFLTSLEQSRNEYIQSLQETDKSDLITAVRPCYPLQKVMVAQSLHQNFEDEVVTYIHHMRFDLDESVDLKALERAWKDTIAANEILRTYFTSVGDDYMQIILRSHGNPFAHLTMASGQTFNYYSLQKKISKELIDKVLDVPPVRFSVMIGEHKQRTLMLSIHHALFDGISIKMLFQDLRSLYEGYKPLVRPCAIPLLRHIATQDIVQSKEYWNGLLKGWENAPLLAGRAFERTAPKEAQRTFRVSLRDLDRQAISLGCTLATLLQCTFGICMARILRTPDIILGLVLSGRTVPVSEVDRMMTPCVTTIPYRMKLQNADQNISQLFALSQKQLSASLEYQHVSPTQIQSWVKADRPLYDCLVSFTRGGMLGADEWPLLRSVAYDFAVDYPLALEIQADNVKSELIVRAAFVETVFSRHNAELLLEKMEILVNVFANQKELTIGAFGLSALRSPVHQVKAFDEEHWTPFEQQLRELIGEFSSVSTANIHKSTSFVQLGVDSLVAIRFAKFLRSHGIMTSSADIVRYNRCGSLAAHMSSEKDTTASDIDPRESSRSHEDALAVLISQGIIDKDDSSVQCYECTPLQVGMLSQSLVTDGGLYWHHHAVQLADDIDLHCLKQAWSTLVSQLDILRTTFHWLPQHRTPWLAVVWPAVDVSWIEVDVSDAKGYWETLPEKSTFTTLIEQSRPLVKVTIVNPGRRPVAIFTLHHCLYDGIAIDMLFQRLWLQYSGFVPPPLMPFHEAARAIARNAQTSIDFWARHVSGYTSEASMTLANDHKWTLNQSIITTDVSQLVESCAQRDMDLRDVCVIAFSKALACLSGRRDVVFGHVIAARHIESDDQADVIGPMFNTVPVRVNLTDQLSSNADMVRGIRKLNADSVGLQHAPLADVQKAWRAQNLRSDGPLIESIFVYTKRVGQGHDATKLGDLLKPDNVPAASEYPLNCEVEQTDDKIELRISSSLASDKIKCFDDDFRNAFFDMLENQSRFAVAFPERLQTLSVKSSHILFDSKIYDESALDMYAGTIRDAISQIASVPGDRIRPDCSIHSFGIDSIAAIRIVSLCRKRGVQISYLDMMQGITIGRICEILAARAHKEEMNSNEVSSCISPVERNEALTVLGYGNGLVEDVLPCLPGQVHYILNWLNSGRTLYEPGWTLKATRRLDVDSLRTSWRRLRGHHPILRTTFAAIDKHEVIQVITNGKSLDDTSFVVVQADKKLIDVLRDQAFIEARSPSDLFTPPVRLRLLQATDGDAVMLYVHHGLYDAWTMPRMISDLSIIYQGGNPEPASSFADFVRGTQTSMDAAAEKAFWRSALKDCELTILPSSKLQVDKTDLGQVFRLVETKTVRVADLEQLCATRNNLSAQHILLLAFARTLARSTNVTNPVFGLYQLGRSGATADDVDGPCVNNLPFGLVNALGSDTLDSLRNIQAALSRRAAFEQSHPDIAVASMGLDSACLPYNAHLNVLWNKMSLAGTRYAQQDLFVPYEFGQATDYSSSQAIIGETPVDALDVMQMPQHNVYVDIEPGENGILIGVMANRVLMQDSVVTEFITDLERSILDCVVALRACV